MTRNRASARAAGSSFEKLIANGLAELLDDDRIERRTKNGANDRGDITGVKTIRGARVVIEAKNTARDNLPAWIREAAVEAGNDDAPIGVVAHKKHGSAIAADQYVTMTLATFALLLEGGPPLERVIINDPTRRTACPYESSTSSREHRNGMKPAVGLSPHPRSAN